MISELRLQNFRCFDGVQLELPDRGALFIGDNAQGKTTLLEAVCMLVRLQSPRVKRTKPMVLVGSSGFGIAGECWGTERLVKYGRGGLFMSVDGEETLRQSDYFLDGGLVVWLGNSDLDLIRGGSEGRRRYLDFLACQLDPQYRQSLGRYRRALKVRNLLLKDTRSRESEIAAYDEILIEHGDYLMAKRQTIIESLVPVVAHAQQFIGGGKEEFSMEYRSGGGIGMREALSQAFEKERHMRQTVVGPHRDDAKLLLNGLSANDYASEGQQRTLAIALKLAQGRMLETQMQRLPVYLLDDVFGELDPQRRNALIEYLPSDAQTLITTTNIDWLDEKWDSWKRFTVDNGKVDSLK